MSAEELRTQIRVEYNLETLNTRRNTTYRADEVLLSVLNSPVNVLLMFPNLLQAFVNLLVLRQVEST